MNSNLQIAIDACLAAGTRIKEIYKQDFTVEFKEDNSPLTKADKMANEVINEFLSTTKIPIISEENEQTSFEERRHWDQCWIVDPLDGTKEFVKKNGEFTVNIALVKEGKPQLGVIFAPILNVIYFAEVSEGKAFKTSVSEEGGNWSDILKNSIEIKPDREINNIRVVVSRSHLNEETKIYLENLKLRENKEVEVVPQGSSLKFCLVAEGKADSYPRFGPTMEWDTAAGQAICEAVGLNCIFLETKEIITYNREKLLNGNFIVSYEG